VWSKSTTTFASCWQYFWQFGLWLNNALADIIVWFWQLLLLRKNYSKYYVRACIQLLFKPQMNGRYLTLEVDMCN
jgi:hypothetical protein